jgi:RNA polymerase sigma factor (sigma-70 family)
MSAPLFFVNHDAKILDMIRTGNDEGLVMLYQLNRRAILSYVRHNSGNADDAEDLLQEALIVLWERVRTNRFEYKSQLSTFIYATVKNMWRRRLARMRREAPADIEEDTGRIEDASALDILVESEEARYVHEALNKIGEPCKTLLILFYWEEKTMEEIAVQLKFANAETAKSKKYQCKKSLQRLLRVSV